MTVNEQTELKFKIIPKKEAEKSEDKNGVYLAEYDGENRLLFFSYFNRLEGVINPTSDGKFVLQMHHNEKLYKNLKKVKKITMEIELA